MTEGKYEKHDHHHDFEYRVFDYRVDRSVRRGKSRDEAIRKDSTTPSRRTEEVFPCGISQSHR